MAACAPSTSSPTGPNYAIAGNGSGRRRVAPNCTVPGSYRDGDAGAGELPKVSVIIPAYNRVDTLREAIASVLSGSYSNIEIVVSDDCSPTDLAPVVAEFRDSRLAYRRNAVNLGVAANMAAALGETSGPYATVLNDDDRWEPDFLS